MHPCWPSILGADEALDPSPAENPSRTEVSSVQRLLATGRPRIFINTYRAGAPRTKNQREVPAGRLRKHGSISRTPSLSKSNGVLRAEPDLRPAEILNVEQL